MNQEMISKIKALKPAKFFRIETNAQQQEVLKVGKTLKQFGSINFDVVTRKQKSGGWKVAAI